MSQDEREQILASALLLRDWEDKPDPRFDPYSDMSDLEKSKLLMLLSRMHQSDQKRLEEMQSASQQRNDELLAQLKELQEMLQSSLQESRELRLQISDLMKSLQRKEAANVALEEQLRLYKQHTFGGKSQKRTYTAKSHSQTHQEDKDDYDGTPGSLGSSEESVDSDSSGDQDQQTRDACVRLYRRGVRYQTMKAEQVVTHSSDGAKLPQGAHIIGRYYKYSYEQISQIIEHRYEVIKYKTADGLLHEGYFPQGGEPEQIDVVPGTHASSNLLAYQVFNRYVLDTPLYRELYRIKDEKMRLCRMTLCNWLDKGACFGKEAVKLLMSLAVGKDSIVNCDETWCRVKVNNSYRKKYIWCLVNKEAKIVIYQYEDGSRGRDVLRHMLGDTQVKALQSDGYNVYMYLDDELIDTEHLCCMAHARAKFKYAFDQGQDKEAEYVLNCMGELYGLESGYEKSLLTPEQIQICRQSLKTKDIIGRLRSKLDALKSSGHPPRGDLMDKAVNYLDRFWEQLFAYLNDGRYSIDNSIAERFIRPLAGERKNSLFFGSHKMAGVSAVYHTLISTCRMQGVSVLDYFKKFFQAIVQGRRDYDNLLPMTIGLKLNKQ